MEKKELSLNFIWKIRLSLRAEGDRLWAEAILEMYGNIRIEWRNYNSTKMDHECHLETGEVFKP